GRDQYGAGHYPYLLTLRQVHYVLVVCVQDFCYDLVLRVPHDVASARAEHREDLDPVVDVPHGGEIGGEAGDRVGDGVGLVLEVPPLGEGHHEIHERYRAVRVLAAMARDVGTVGARFGGDLLDRGRGDGLDERPGPLLVGVGHPVGQALAPGETVTVVALPDPAGEQPGQGRLAGDEAHVLGAKHLPQAEHHQVDQDRQRQPHHD